VPVLVVPPVPSTPAVPVVLVCPARPRHRPPARRQISPVPSSLVAPVVLVCPARPRHRPPARRQIPPAPPHWWRLWFWCARPGSVAHGRRSQHSQISHV